MAYLCLLCENCRQLPSADISLAVFFAYTSLTSSENWKTKNCQSIQDFNQVLYSAIDVRQCYNNHHGDIVPEKARGTFLCSLRIKIKIARQIRSSTAGYVCSTKTKDNFNPYLGAWIWGITTYSYEVMQLQKWSCRKSTKIRIFLR